LNIKPPKTITVHVILCGCETWSVTPREVITLGVFENRVLRRILGCKKEEEKGG
jgi:hypothetical protein